MCQANPHQVLVKLRRPVDQLIGFRQESTLALAIARGDNIGQLSLGICDGAARIVLVHHIAIDQRQFDNGVAFHAGETGPAIACGERTVDHLGIEEGAPVSQAPAQKIERLGTGDPLCGM